MIVIFRQFLTKYYLVSSEIKKKNNFFGKNNKNAFSVAECLLTLVVIGVISALVMPVLHTKYNNIKTVYVLKKQYTIYNNIYNTIVQTKGPLKYWGLKSVKDLDEIKKVTDYFLPYLKYEEKCISVTGCWAFKPINALNEKIAAPWTSTANKGGGIGDNFVVYKMKDGTIVNLDVYDNLDIINRFGVKNTSKYNLVIFVDINGNVDPNVIGRDIFAFTITDRGFLPAGVDSTANCSVKDETKFAGLQCAAKVLKEEGINY